MPGLGDTTLGKRNALLAALPSASRRRVLAKAQFASAKPDDIVHAPGAAIEQVLFPTEGMISLLSPAGGEPEVEIALVGAEGFVGLPLLFGVELPRTVAVARAPTYSLVLSVRSFREELEQNRSFAKILYAYAFAFLCATSIRAACAAAHFLEQRCARWLLTVQDRLGTDSFPLTHEAIARALNVRRASVTAAVAKLRRDGAIDFARGLVIITDRKRLEKAACGCYQRIRSEYAALL